MTHETQAALQRAIDALEAQRAVLGDAAVDAALTALRGNLRAAELGTLSTVKALAPEEERKHISILFADLVGLDVLAMQLDPEELSAVSREFLAALTLVAQRFNGTFFNVGDAMMVLFGAPIALANHAEMAVRAGLAMQAALGALNDMLAARHQVRLALRIGINTGEVLAGALHSARPNEYTVLGDAVNLASRLQHLCVANCLLVGESTHRQTRALFDFDGPHTVTVRGKSEPVATYTVRGVRALTQSQSGVSGLHAPMIGRESALAALQSAYLRAVSGVTALGLTVVGDIGLGKSRLRREFRHWLSVAHPDALVLVARCYSHTRAVPFHLAGDLIRAHFRVAATDAPEIARVKLASGLSQTFSSATEAHPSDEDDRYLVAALAAMLGLTMGEENLLAPLDPPARRERILRSFERVLRDLALRQPLVLILEDLHWSDHPSLDAYEQALVALRGVPVLIVGLTRPVREPSAYLLQVEGRLAQSVGDRYARLFLRELNAGQTEELIRELLRGGQIPDDLISALATKSEGNPFYVEELVRVLIDNGTLVRVRGNVWQAARPVTDVSVPDSIQNVLAERLDRLTAQEKHVIQRAAVIGRSFEPSLLAALLDGPVDDTLKSLATRELIHPSGPARFGDQQEWVFHHNLVQEVAYLSMPQAARRRLHRQIGEWLLARAGDADEDVVSLLAHHFGHSDRPELGLRYLLRAALSARRAFANSEALRHYALAEELLAELPAVHVARHAYEIAVARGEVLSLLGNSRAAEEAFMRAGALAEAANDQAGRALARLEIARVARRQGALLRAREEAQVAESLARAAQALPVQAAALAERGAALHLHGHYDEAARCWRDALELNERVGEMRASAYCLNWLAHDQTERGHHTRAREWYARAQSRLELAGDKAGLSQSLTGLAYTYWTTGELVEAERLYAQSLALRRALGDRQGIADGLSDSAEVPKARGEYQPALALYREAGAIYRQVGSQMGLALYHYHLGETQYLLGDNASALEALVRAEQLARDLQFGWLLPDVQRQLGTVLITQGRYVEAREHIDTAMQVAETLGRPALRGLVCRALAQWYAQAPDDNRAQAEALWRESLDLLTSLGWRVERARTLLGYARALRLWGALQAGAFEAQARADAHAMGVVL